MAVYTDVDGKLLTDASGVVHTEGCGDPPCCGSQTWWLATECDGEAELYVLTSTTCSNGGGSVGGKVIVYFGVCYLVDDSVEYDTDELPAFSLRYAGDPLECFDDCESSPCYGEYKEMSYCLTIQPSRPNSRRVFVPLARVDEYDTSSCNNCCQVWEINGECVTTPGGSVVTSIPPGAFLASGPADSYPGYNTCCDCLDTCDTETINFYISNPTPGFTAYDCVEPGSYLGRHTIAYQSDYEEVTENILVPPFGTFVNTENDGVNGTNVWWQNDGATPVLVDEGVVFSGDAVREPGISGLNGVPVVPWFMGHAFYFRYRLGLIFPDDVFTPFNNAGNPIPPATLGSGSQSFSGKASSQTQPRDYTISFNFTVSAVAFACGSYNLVYSGSMYGLEERFGPRPTVSKRITTTHSLSVSITGTTDCGPGPYADPCCRIEIPSPAPLYSGGGTMPGSSLGSSLVRPGGALSRLLGGKRAADVLGPRPGNRRRR